MNYAPVNLEALDRSCSSSSSCCNSFGRRTSQALYDMLNEDNNADNFNRGPSYFVIGFVTIWAVGYSIIGYIETMQGGMGDLGGYVGAAFLIVLLFALIGAVAVEVFKDDELPRN